MEFGNGSVFNLSAEFLRIHSPAVDAKVRSIAGEKVNSQSFCYFINICIYNIIFHLVYEIVVGIILNVEKAIQGYV